MECTGCTISLVDACTLFKNCTDSIEFLRKHGILSREIKCSQCGESAALNKKTLQWRCQRVKKVKKNKKIIRKKCNFTQSIKTDTWLHNSHLSPDKCCLFVSLYIILNPPHEIFLMEELKMNSETVCNWSSYIREALEHWLLFNSSDQLGGPGKIVEIDEAKFGKRKYNRGRIIEGQWIFGGFERESKQVFMEKVDDRTSATLLEIIKRRIKPGTTIMSDCWKAYNCLNEEGFQHLTVNHSLNFVNPDSGAYTQNIERIWRDARGNIPKFGRRDYHMAGYIADFLFRRVFTAHSERVHAIFDAIQHFYNEELSK